MLNVSERPVFNGSAPQFLHHRDKKKLRSIRQLKPLHPEHKPVPRHQGNKISTPTLRAPTGLYVPGTDLKYLDQQGQDSPRHRDDPVPQIRQKFERRLGVQVQSGRRMRKSNVKGHESSAPTQATRTEANHGTGQQPFLARGVSRSTSGQADLVKQRQDHNERILTYLKEVRPLSIRQIARAVSSFDFSSSSPKDRERGESRLTNTPSVILALDHTRQKVRAWHRKKELDPNFRAPSEQLAVAMRLALLDPFLMEEIQVLAGRR